MGHSETATAFIGIKIVLSELIAQLNETNFSVIKNMLCEGYIDDSNEYYNEVYDEIIQRERGMDDYIDCLKFKEYFTHEFKSRGSYLKSTYSNRAINDVSQGCLFDKTLLVPVKKIISTERWGYNRYGTNGTSIPFDFDLCLSTEQFKDINHITKVFMIKQGP
jgi:hypothetical protein